MKKAFAAAGAAGLMLTGAGTAMAAPSGDVFSLDCVDGNSYSVTTPPGHGNYTPAFDDATHKVFIPVFFGESSYAAFENGIQIEAGTDPGGPRNGGLRKGQSSVECSFYATFTEGTVSGYYTGIVYIKAKK